MNLGIKREMLGDIILKDNTAYAFCLGQISGYIIDNLTRIKHTTVSAKSIPSLPDNARVQPTEQEFFVPSLRLDALVSKAYRLSRSETSKLFEQGKVFVNSRLVQSTSYTLKENDIVSVRGFGRLVFNAVVRTTKKDRLVISVLIYR
jgi:RNA-binding protein YlmH